MWPKDITEGEKRQEYWGKEKPQVFSEHLG